MTQDPEYLLLPDESSTEVLAGYWREPWLSKRIVRPEILDALRAQSFEEFRLGREIAGLSKTVRDRRAAQVGGDAPLVHGETSVGSGDQTFVERLYRSSNSYADRLTQEELEAIHVEFGVDGYLLNQAETGRQIVITGNPGDGKTHLIERLRPRLEELGARVITDANACANTEILETWQECRREEQPFILAINEWPLHVLRRHTQQSEFSWV